MFPGLAVAAVLHARGHRVSVILSGRAVEAERAKADLPEGIEPLLVPVSPVSIRRPLSLAKLLAAILRARRELRRFRPDALLAMGSYTSVAPVLAARSLGIPVVLHEANAIPGSAIARLARFAATVCITFPEAAKHFPSRARIVDTGLPLRASFEKGIGGSRAPKDRPSLLIMGGSQGAAALNRIVVAALATRKDSPGPPWKIVHLAGTRNEAEVRSLYAEAGLAPPRFEVEVVGFEHDMARRYAEASLCVSRAGASSCFELALSGLPAIFIPMPLLARDHQTFNAKSMADRGAGLFAAQSSLQPDTLATLLSGIAGDPDRCSAMRTALLAAARPDAAERVATAVEEAAGAPC